MSLTVSTRLGPYEVTAHIGAGGMGEVHNATDTRLNRIVAIQVLPEHVANDPARKQWFERVTRKWQTARAWLFRRLTRGTARPQP